MNRFFVFIVATISAFYCSQASAALQFGDAVFCLRGDGAGCTEQMIGSSYHKKILVLPTGYTASEYESFRQDFYQLVETMDVGGTVYSTEHADKIIYVGFWVASPSLESGRAAFGAKIIQHPIRDSALTMKQSRLFAFVESLQKIDSKLFNPFAVLAIYNSDRRDATANASPPSFIQKPYGIARMTRGDLYEGAYIPVHELGHAALNFVDEYVEPGLENMSIRTIDRLTPLALLGNNWGSWVRAVRNLFGVYSYRISDVLAANGNDNVDVTQYPSRVFTSGFFSENYENEGGMFFGRGTYHDSGNNLMNDDDVQREHPDGFSYAHSLSQQRVIRTVFEHPGKAARPNDRIRAAGPSGSWRFEWGSTTHLLLFDADKHHQFQPTVRYDVQIGWYDRDWKLCWAGGFFPTPCYEKKWVVVQKAHTPVARTIQLPKTGLFKIAKVTQTLACHLGADSIRPNPASDGTFNLCSDDLSNVAQSFLPTLEFPMPYQDIGIPAKQWMTKYHWRFRTYNGTYHSGWTGWSSFTRAL